VKYRLEVRLYPNARQLAACEHLLLVTRRLWNLLLAQRRDAWKARRLKISSKRQYHELTELRAVDPWFASVYRECEDAVLHRLDLAYQKFFSGSGHPRYKPASRWNQFEFSHGDRALRWERNQDRITIPGVGSVRVRKGRTRVIPAHGRAMVYRRCGRWYALFECEIAPKPLPRNGRVVGIDRGIRALAATSDGELIANPRHGAALALKLARAQRTVERRTIRDAAERVRNGDGKNRNRAVKALQRVWDKLKRARRSYLHEVSRSLVDRYDAIAFEQLSLAGMTRSTKGSKEHPGRNVRAKKRLNYAMLDASLAMLRTLVGEKAASAARLVIDVPAAYSSQTCSECGFVAAEARSGERYACVVAGCGYAGDADLNAARVIAQRAFGRPAGRSAGMSDSNDLRSELSPGGTRLARQECCVRAHPTIGESR
jgi:putative transposase